MAEFRYIVLRNVKNGEEIYKVEGHRVDTTRSLSLSSDEKYLTSSGSNHKIKLWKLKLNLC